MAMELVTRLPYDHPYRWDGTTVGGQKLWRPDELGADLALWLDAEDTASITLNGGNVSQWDDKSGNGNHAAQAVSANQPAYLATGFNSNPSIDFDGSNDQLTTSYVLDFPFSISAAVQNDTGGVRGAVGSGPRRPALGILTAAPAQNSFALWNPDLDRGAYINNTQTTVPVILYSDAASDDRLGWNIYVDGSNAGQVNENIGTLNPADIVRIGYTGVTSEYWNGRISEVVITSQPLSTANRQKLEGYLAHKWGLTDNLPIEHPYKITPPYAGAPVYDPDAQTYFNRVEGPTGDNQTLEAAVKTAINNFVVSCKADGIWDAIKSSAILAGARTLSGALQPLAGTAPTNFNFVSGDYNRKTGLKGDGSTKYLDSNRANDADPQNSNHNAVYVTALDTVTGRGSALMAGGFTETGSNNLGYSSTEPNSFFRNRSASSTGVAGGQDETGLFATNRSTSSTYQYRFGGVTGTITETSETPDSSDVLVFSRSDGFATDARLSFYSIGESIDLAALDTRVSALMTALDGAIA